MKIEKIKKRLLSIKSFINRGSAITTMLIFMLLSSSFFAVSIFGINNSSFCYLEQSCHSLRSSLGSYVHIRYFLGNESEGRIKSAISEVNDFNSYRIKEIDRTASYVLEDDFQVEYDSDYHDTSDIIYGDYYSQYFTTNRLSLLKGSFDEKEFYDDTSIYISNRLLNEIPSLTINDAIGAKIKLSLDLEKEYTIRGIVDADRGNHSGVHFKKIFSDNFILLNAKHVYDYGYSDLFLCTDDYYFADDLCEFESKLDKSYLKYDEIDMKATYLDEEKTLCSSDVFRMQKYNSASVVFSVLTIISLIIILGTFILMIVIYDFNKLTLFEKINMFIIIILWSFIPMVVGLFLMGKIAFISRATISLLIAFAAISSFVLLWRFSFFKTSIDDNEEKDGSK